MSQNNGNSEATWGLMIFAFIATMAIYAVAFIAALAAFVTLLATLACLFAWEKPIRIGRLYIATRNARAFIYRGCAGAVLVPVFALFCGAMYGLRFSDQAMLNFALLGYVLASAGLEFWEIIPEEDQSIQWLERGQDAPELLPPPERKALPAPKTPSHPWGPSIDVVEGGKPQQPPFRFASWDDEEELRK